MDDDAPERIAETLRAIARIKRSYLRGAARLQRCSDAARIKLAEAGAVVAPSETAGPEDEVVGDAAVDDDSPAARAERLRIERQRAENYLRILWYDLNDVERKLVTAIDRVESIRSCLWHLMTLLRFDPPESIDDAP